MDDVPRTLAADYDAACHRSRRIGFAGRRALACGRGRVAVALAVSSVCQELRASWACAAISAGASDDRVRARFEMEAGVCADLAAEQLRRAERWAKHLRVTLPDGWEARMEAVGRECAARYRAPAPAGGERGR